MGTGVGHMVPTWENLERGCRAFHLKYPYEPYYENVTRVLRDDWFKVELQDLRSSTNAICLFLAGWNRAFYRGGGPGGQHVVNLLEEERATLLGYAARSIDSFEPEKEERKVKDLFFTFSNHLGKTMKKTNDRRAGHISAAKALHVLAPNLFPLMDRAIARAYGCGLEQGDGSKSYFNVMRKVREEVVQLGGTETGLMRVVSFSGHVGGLLKAIDEWNFAKKEGWV